MFARVRAARRALPVLALALALLATGCGASEEVATPSPEAESSSAEFPRTVTHDQGRTEIAAEPLRVVALDNSLVDAMVALDVPLVGGIGSYNDQTTFADYLGDAVADTVDVGPLAQPNLEQIVALQPDLIVSATVRHEALYEQLSGIAPTVFVATTGPTWKDNIRLMGEVTGKEDRADELLTAYEARAAALGAAINERAGDPTVSMVRFVDGPTRLYGRASYSGIVFADMGLARPAPQDVDEFAVEISEEEIALADADHIFVSVYSGAQDVADRFQANPLWPRLAGAQAGNVHPVRDAVWMTAVGLQGADLMMDDLAEIFGVDPQRS